MQNELSTQTAKSYDWRVIVGIAIIVGRSWRGAGRKMCATVSPYGLRAPHIFGRSPYRVGFQQQRLATKFFLEDGILSAETCRGHRVFFTTVLSSSLIRTEATFHIFISSRSRKHPNGSRTWLAVPVLAIKRKR